MDSPRLSFAIVDQKNQQTQTKNQLKDNFAWKSLVAEKLQ